MKRKSIIQTDLDECWVCGTKQNIHIHHIFYGTSNRKQSEKYGCIIALCQEHHTGNEGVHFNRALDITLKRTAQVYFETHIGNRDEFREIFGKSYL